MASQMRFRPSYEYMEHSDTLSGIGLTNRDSPMKRAGCKILTAYLDASTKWGM